MEMKALAGMKPIWLRTSIDPLAGGPTVETYNSTKEWQGEAATEPPLSWLSLVAYPVLGVFDTGYLALETLLTKSVLLSIATQAIALSLLYFLERLQAPAKALRDSS